MNDAVFAFCVGLSYLDRKDFVEHQLDETSARGQRSSGLRPVLQIGRKRHICSVALCRFIDRYLGNYGNNRETDYLTDCSAAVCESFAARLASSRRSSREASRYLSKFREGEL